MRNRESGYYEVRLFLPIEAFELVGLSLFELGAMGTVEEETGLVAYFDASTDMLRLFHDVKKAAERVCRRLNCEGEPRLEMKRCKDRDWSSEWKAGWKPIRIGERLMIKPSWLERPADAPPIIIEIDPQMAFGSGDHATTRMTLQLIECSVRRGDRLLDVGAGTGILAIAALKLGAATAVAFDVDPIAAGTAKKNAEINAVGRQMLVFAGGIEALRPHEFDLIAANIQRSVIIPLLPAFNRLLPPNGKCLISGILLDEENQIRQACLESGLKVTQMLRENEWLAFEAVKA